MQLEESEDGHRQEIATMQLKFKTKCGGSDKTIAALEKKLDLGKMKLNEKSLEHSAAKKAGPHSAPSRHSLLALPQGAPPRHSLPPLPHAASSRRPLTALPHGIPC